ncbi:hypothetical protein EDB81DRAFT_80170 [Dactylonectria macrodidyma]|uniref:Uncharacterized protein n=1 Tax=Dactylonectria macrodidyma TaxID=307937 RepID=A0A9P9EBX3_9HYPO|nr:hypothetical protein EDB81DRAFT_80170 [Dactylonectria macrodidyma]
MVTHDARETMGQRGVDRISGSFQDVKWLGLTMEYKPYPFVGDAGGAHFLAHEERLCKALRKLPQPKRLALTIFQTQVMYIVRRMNTAEGHPDSDATVVSTDEYTRWYTDLIHRFGLALPELQQLYILVRFPAVYRGIRPEDGGQMVVERVKLQEESLRFTFPVGVFGED